MTSCQTKLTGNLKDVTLGKDRGPADYIRTRIKWHCIEEEN